MAHTALCSPPAGIQQTAANVRKRMALWSVITSELMIQLSKCSNVAEKVADSEPTLLLEVMMISQDVQGGAEMQLIECMAWVEQREESN